MMGFMTSPAPAAAADAGCRSSCGSSLWGGGATISHESLHVGSNGSRSSFCNLGVVGGKGTVCGDRNDGSLLKRRNVWVRGLTSTCGGFGFLSQRWRSASFMSLQWTSVAGKSGHEKGLLVLCTCDDGSVGGLNNPNTGKPMSSIGMQSSMSGNGLKVLRLRHLRRKGVAADAVPNLAETSPNTEVGEEESISEDADVNAISEWELDFCSRPILDSRGKKVWELVVCDSRRQIQFTRFYPNNVINSVTLRDALMYIMETLELPKPEKIRFFRSQMQTIITKACKELDIQPVPSQRCVTLIKWLEERYETVYQQHPGFQEGASPLSLQEQVLPLDLPDTLRGEEWAFVQLPLESVLEEMDGVLTGAVFGSVLDIDNLKIDLSSDVMIPGVAVASSRATPLAAWTNALELGSIDVDIQRSCLVLSTGVADRWRYAFYRKSRQADAEGEAWEAAKKKCGGLHFLAVQESLDSELCTGFWLLIDGQQSPV